ncbi:MAG: diaminopimelate epimerase [Marinifilaceae bacterium]
MQFTKMQGIGNDYIYVYGLDNYIQMLLPLIPRLSDRNFGIGSDGMIFIDPSSTSDFRMQMYNRDGSRSAMCGNGIRCVGKYIYDNGLSNKTTLNIETDAGVKVLHLHVTNGKVASVTVDMGEPILLAKDIPVIAPTERVIHSPFLFDSHVFHLTAVSMGNPHAITFVDSVKEVEIEHIGPIIECDERFPQRVNVDFVEVINHNEVRMRVWERGTGETMACGTGACAVAVACCLNGKTGREVKVHLPGGTLDIVWEEDNHVYMTGPASTSYTGNIDINNVNNIVNL